MSYTADQILSFAFDFERTTSESLVKSAKKKEDKKSKKPAKKEDKASSDKNKAAVKEKDSKKKFPFTKKKAYLQSFDNLITKFAQDPQKYFTAQSTMSQLIDGLAKGIYAQPVKEAFVQGAKSAMEKADDVRTKGKSGEFNADTVRSEMQKYLANAPNTELKNAMNALETAAMQGYAYGKGGTSYGTDAVNELIAKMRTTMGQIFAAAQQMWEAAVAETEAVANNAGPTGTSVKTMDAPAEREKDKDGGNEEPAKPKTPGGRGSMASNADVRKIQEYLIRQPSGEQFKAQLSGNGRLPNDGVDGKLGPNTWAAIRDHAGRSATTDKEAYDKVLEWANEKAAPTPPPLPAPTPAAPTPVASGKVMPNQAYDVTPTQTTPTQTTPPKTPLEQYNSSVKHPWSSPAKPAGPPPPPRELTPSEKRQKKYREDQAAEQAKRTERLKQRGYSADDGQTVASLEDDFFQKLGF